MIIKESHIEQKSSHVLIERNVKRESLTYWTEEKNPVRLSDSSSKGQVLEAKYFEELKKSSKVTLSQIAVATRSSKAVAEPIHKEQSELADLDMLILKEMIERITGKSIKFINQITGTQTPSNVSNEHAGKEREIENVQEENQGFGIIYDYYESHYEQEQTNFSAEGVINTADGLEINISVEMNMNRQFFSEEEVQVRAGDALKDPLVINFDGNSASISERNFLFDIDMDGKENQISFVNEGSGFLAIDKNSDGKINDGGELFGAKTGDGFAELSQYDEDDNGWIDENDSIYEHLRIWVSKGDTKSLIALGEKGVGAIYLGHIETPFYVKNDQNNLLGQVRSSGIFLNEDGTVGTVQQVDLVA